MPAVHQNVVGLGPISSRISGWRRNNSRVRTRCGSGAVEKVNSSGEVVTSVMKVAQPITRR